MTPGYEQLDGLLDALLGEDPMRSSQAMEQLQGLTGRPDSAAVGRAASAAALMLAAGQGEQACRMLESLHDQCDDEPMLLNNLAFACMASGRVERARALWRRAAALAPHDNTIRSNLAVMERQAS
jgi:Flp pilus assembly protein TadD